VHQPSQRDTPESSFLKEIAAVACCSRVGDFSLNGFSFRPFFLSGIFSNLLQDSLHK
jgi:hypothetical protein